MLFAVFANVLKETLTGQFLASLHHPRQAGIMNGYCTFLVTLASELKNNLRTCNIDVLVVERRKPVRVILPFIGKIANPDQRFVQQFHHNGDDLLV